MTIFFLVLIAALIFEYINGFHDAANAVATVISTRVLTPRQAIFLAAVMNLIGAMLGVEVAKTIESGFVNAGVAAITMETVFAALAAGIAWNIITWLGGIPSSSSHALIGGLCGAALAQTEMNWHVLYWDAVVDGKTVGLWPKLVKPMVLSPVLGFFLGATIMLLFAVILYRVRPGAIQRIFGKGQIFSAGWMALSHGMNDAQKTMGIITLALVAGTDFITDPVTGAKTVTGVFKTLPDWLHFLNTESGEVPYWVKITCAITMALGTAGGGLRIIKTMGHKMVKLQPVHGFAAETSASLIIQVASHWGIPLSTTHIISTSIMGVGAMKRLSAMKWGIVSRIVWAWVLTLPVTACLGYATWHAIHALMRLKGMAG